MIYDLTMYSGEDDLLEIRLEELAGAIDKFIIIESEYSHSLVKKPLLFDIKKFSKFSDRIIYVVKDSFHDNAFVNDWAARENLFAAIPNPKSDDILHFSDLDEVTNSDQLNLVLDGGLKDPVNFESSYRFFCLDLYGRKSRDAMLMRYDWITTNFYKYRDARNGEEVTRIPDAGWHFSSVGIPANIVRKWKWFAHYNEVGEQYKNEEWIRNQIKRKAGSWAKGAKDDELRLVGHKYPDLPDYVASNLGKFNHLLYRSYL
tara:strand:+ start:306 stop:1082 length:777 start_codon:yes stop_codon:yes gene_type:complete